MHSIEVVCLTISERPQQSTYAHNCQKILEILRHPQIHDVAEAHVKAPVGTNFDRVRQAHSDSQTTSMLTCGYAFAS
jgi:hypothetical protein